MVDQWPTDIRIDDATDVVAGGGMFPTLSRTWNELETRFSDADEWRKLAVWAFFQAAHNLAVSSYRSRRASISLIDISIADFERFMLKNLADESWDNERQFFEVSHR